MYSKKCCQLFILSSKSSLEEGAMMTTYLGNYFYFETIKYIQIPSASHSQPCLDHLCLAGRHAGQISKTHLKCLRCWDSSTAWWKVLHACLTSYSILQYSLWAHERCRSQMDSMVGCMQDQQSVTCWTTSGKTTAQPTMQSSPRTSLSVWMKFYNRSSSAIFYKMDQEISRWNPLVIETGNPQL